MTDCASLHGQFSELSTMKEPGNDLRQSLLNWRVTAAIWTLYPRLSLWWPVGNSVGMES